MLKALHQIRGVKLVSKGKGKGGRVAYAGDIFEPANSESGARLVREGSAIRADQKIPEADKQYRGPDVVEGQVDISNIAERMPNSQHIEDHEDDDDDAQPEVSAKTTKGKKAKGAGAKAKESKESAIDDLGLGDGSTDE